MGQARAAGRGPPPAMANYTTVRVEVLRAFWLQGQTCGVGAQIDVDVSLARELVYANKARLAPTAQAASGEPAAKPRTRRTKEPA